MNGDPKSKIGKGKVGRTNSPWRFLGDRRGSTAIEFSILAAPFAYLVFAILASCISFAGQEVMTNITDDIARQLRTGQLRQADVAGNKLQDMICSRLEIVVAKDCPGLLVDLRAFATFDEAAKAGFKISGEDIVLTSSGSDTPFKVETGLAESRNMLRVFYKWPVLDFMAKYMANIQGGKELHFASVTWQNEPFNN